MGFFDGFARGMGLGEAKQRRENREISEWVDDLQDDRNNYRQKAFEYSDSNRGWYTCARCGKKFRRTGMDVDHIVPRSKGGDNSIHNLQLLCAHCNRSKGADTKDTFSDFIRRESELRKMEQEDVKMMNYVSKKKR